MDLSPCIGSTGLMLQGQAALEPSMMIFLKESAGHDDINAAWARNLCTGTETPLRSLHSPEVMAKQQGNSVIMGRRRWLDSNERMKKPINEDC
jgi:hypothetical protein